MKRLSTKQLMQMSLEQIYQICGSDGCFKNCPFKKSLHKYREDGFCIKETYEKADEWIEEDEISIKCMESWIKSYKDRIKRYKKLKQKISKEIEVGQMFEELLNKKVREFKARAKRKEYQEMNKIGHCYVEYYQERLYWVYDYDTNLITMIYASSPSEAVAIHNTN